MKLLSRTSEEIKSIQRLHTEAFGRLSKQLRTLPGARELLSHLTATGVRWAIATSGRLKNAQPALDILGIGTDVTVVTRDEVPYAKPDPDLFMAAANRLGVDLQNAVVVGDSVWDMLAARRARALDVGLLSGGYGQDKLERADISMKLVFGP